MAQLRGAIPNRETLSHKIDQGDSLAITLTESPAVATSWHLRVFVRTDQGFFLLGELDTRTGNPSRVVAVCCCPGVREWTVEAYSADVAAVADLFLQDGDGLGHFGITPLEPAPPEFWNVDVLSPGTYYFPNIRGIKPPKNLSLQINSAGGACVVTVEASQNAFNYLVADITPSGYCCTSTTPYAASYSLASGNNLQLDFDDLRAEQLRVKVVVSTPTLAFISVLGEP